MSDRIFCRYHFYLLVTFLAAWALLLAGTRATVASQPHRPKPAYRALAENPDEVYCKGTFEAPKKIVGFVAFLAGTRQFAARNSWRSGAIRAPFHPFLAAALPKTSRSPPPFFAFPV